MVQPALKRVKTSKSVVDFIQREILDGRLRPGDRIDVEAISRTLGVSPTPVREALTLLERDGVVATKVHRAALVEHFDARTLRADFHVLGLLSGVTVARVALHRQPDVVAELQRLLSELEASPERAGELATEILRVEHRAGATPRLRAELRGFSGFLETAARIGDRRTHDELVAGHARVIDAIAAGEESKASAARLAEARAVGEDVIRELIRRGVLEDDGLASP